MRLRCVYLDLDGTLLGQGGSLLRDGVGGFSNASVRALEACHRAGVEPVLFTGRTRATAWSAARLLGMTSMIYEAGGGVLLDGEDELLVGEEWAAGDGRSVWQRIEDSGAPALLLEAYAGLLEPHSPWHLGRDITHLFRGTVDADEANALLAEHGFDSLRLIDNGAVTDGGPGLRLLHLQPAGTSKARAVARHMQNRGYAREECIAVGDSREDLGAAAAVGTFWLVANALRDDPQIRSALPAGACPLRVAEGAHGEGVYEAVLTTLAERR